MRKFHAFLDSVGSWHHPNVDLALPGQPYAGNQAGAEIHHPTINPRHVCIGIEHCASIGEETANTISGKLEEVRPVWWPGQESNLRPSR